jgi:hypothetical protein
MFKLICSIALSAALLCAQNSSEPNRGGTNRRVLSSKGTKLPAEMNAPPASAERIADDTYRYVDPKGKKWIYKKTPFGWSKQDESQMAAPVKKEEEEYARVVGIDGDTIRFERPGPFGSFKWEKKKSELNDMEKAALTRSQNGKK